MRLFHRTSLVPAAVLAMADDFFPRLALTRTAEAPSGRSYAGALGAMALSIRMDGGHYTVVEVATDQIGESRLDKNVKKFFVQLHRRADPTHKIQAGF